MPRAFPILLALTLVLPPDARAQMGFAGVGGGLSILSGDRVAADYIVRPSLLARAGIGGGRVKLVLGYEAHGLGDPTPRASDFRGGTLLLEREIIRTDFFLLGVQLEAREFYVRPTVGWSRNSFASFHVPNGMDAESAETRKEGGPSWGVSVGYRLRLGQKYGLAIEASVLRAGGDEVTGARDVLAVTLIPITSF